MWYVITIRNGRAIGRVGSAYKLEKHAERVAERLNRISDGDAYRAFFYPRNLTGVAA